MIKTVKVITWIVVALTMYSFVGGIVYNLHDRVYPGMTYTENPDDVPFPGSAFMGLLWPISVPVWGAVELAAIVAGMSDSAMDELIP